MTLYHGTTKVVWDDIQQEGVLWGRKDVFYFRHDDGSPRYISRCTYLARDKKHAGIYDSKGITDESCVILEVNVPEIETCGWQIRHYDPIPLENIKVL